MGALPTPEIIVNQQNAGLELVNAQNTKRLPNASPTFNELVPLGSSVLHIVTGETDPNAKAGKFNEFIDRLNPQQRETYNKLVSKVIEEHGVFIESVIKKYSDYRNHDEAYSSTLQKVFLGLRTYKGDATMTTWLFRITRNAIKSIDTRIHRTNRQQVSYEATELQIADDKSESGLQGVLNKLILFGEGADRLKVLSSGLREVFILRTYNNLSYDEIAEELDITVSAAKVRMHRAKKILENNALLDLDSDKTPPKVA